MVMFFQIINDVVGEYFQYCYTSLNNWKASNQSLSEATR